MIDRNRVSRKDRWNQEETKVGITLPLIVLILLAIAIYTTNKLITKDSKPDSDCIEWAVEVRYPDGTKAWAKTHSDPKTRDEAEQIARELESQDRGGRYYEAKCKKWKGD